MNRIKECKGILLHKVAFLKVRNSNSFLKAHISILRAFNHDLVKLFTTFFLGDKIATKLHRKYAGHHQEEKMNFKQRVEAFCDWECARYTKPEKPLNGEETFEKYYSNVGMKGIINNFNKAK